MTTAGHAAARRQPLDVGTDGGDVEEQPLERAGDGHLPHRLGGLAVDDEQALDADGEVARDGVDPGVQAGQRPHHEGTLVGRGQRGEIALPGATASAWMPGGGVDRLPRTAEPVEARPSRRPV